ncbi:putative F-box/LRR-repeat protein At4g15060 [Prunus avium]|uniref:F-box/LRR-repeat protein At4g15060 n=1 Tax=Prunus avium TaxID=42229 RepID=A0A6P5SVS2_PRUAV|nr:putative F-box/LRR-repeat protein At4g15060 [Prunus avium]
MYKDDGEYNKSEELGTKRRKIIKDDEHNLELVAAEEEDQISKLPHEVVVSIVSLLTLKEAAATSILFRRWRYVWASTTTLNFEAVNFEDRNTLDYFYRLDEDILNQEGRKYVNWVNRVLEQHRGQSIERFRVIFFLDKGFTSDIDKWIQFAMEKRVQVLQLDLLAEWVNYSPHDYAFPYKLLGFKSLKVIRFRHVAVTGELVEFLLSNCPLLERVSLTIARDLTHLRVVSPSIALKYLEIKYCQQLENIEISNANIVSFVFCGFLVPLHLKNVPRLVEVAINKLGNYYSEFIRFAFSQLSPCLSHLEILKLDIREAVYNPNHVFPILANLKHLQLLVDADHYLSLGRLASFMKAAPYMRTLNLGLGMGTPDWKTAIIEKATAKCPHHYLKEVEISGYRGYECYVEHVMYLKMNVVALEKIIINPFRFWCWPTGNESNGLEVNEEEDARDHAIRYLQQNCPLPYNMYASSYKSVRKMMQKLRSCY